jgi:uncharacterized protein (PEP-CTERM system associated)
MVITIADRQKAKMSCKLPQYLLGVASMFIVALTPHAHAAEWNIRPTTDIRQTYTDNVNLAGKGAEKSDFVTEITPGVSITAVGRDLNVRVNYSMQNLLYANNSNAGTIKNQLNADAHATLVDELFFWDAKGLVTQQNISPLGAQTTDNINTTGNLANVKTYTLSPYLHHRFGAAAIGELRYTHDDVSTNTALLNSNMDTVLLKLDSGPSFSTIGWGFQYNDQKTNYVNSSASMEMQSASANVGYLITPRFSLIETVGYEKNSYSWTGGSPAGRFWNSGFSWAPTDRTSISASAGKRFYGSTYSLASRVRSRTTIWSLSYAEDITTTQNQFLQNYNVNWSVLLAPQVANEYYASQEYANSQQILAPADLQTRVERYMALHGLTNANTDNYFSNRVFLQKKLQGAVLINSSKSTYAFSGYYSRRTSQTASTVDSTLYGVINSLLMDKTKEAGANAQWNWKIFPRTALNLNTDYIRVSAPSIGGKSDTKRITLDVTKHLQPKLDGSIGYRHVLQKTSQVIGPITEDAIFASLQMRF